MLEQKVIDSGNRELVCTERPLVTAEKAAQLLGVSKVWLYRLDAATPGVYRLGRAKRFDPDALKAWARSQAEGSNQR